MLSGRFADDLSAPGSPFVFKDVFETLVAPNLSRNGDFSELYLEKPPLIHRARLAISPGPLLRLLFAMGEAPASGLCRSNSKVRVRCFTADRCASRRQVVDRPIIAKVRFASLLGA